MSQMLALCLHPNDVLVSARTGLISIWDRGGRVEARTHTPATGRGSHLDPAINDSMNTFMAPSRGVAGHERYLGVGVVVPVVHRDVPFSAAFLTVVPADAGVKDVVALRQDLFLRPRPIEAMLCVYDVVAG